MNPEDLSSNPSAVPRRGLAIASLVLGIVGLCLSLFVIGGILGMVGVTLGLVHIVGKRGRTAMAWWGVSLSFLSMVAAICLGFVYFHVFQMVKETMAAPPMEGGSLAEWEGVLAPEITITNLEGGELHLSELRDKRVVLDFWATWCGPCVKELPEFIRLRKETPEQELAVIGISQEDPEKLRSFVKKKGINYPIASAANLPEPFNGIQAIPTTFFIDRKGVIQSVVVGGREYSELRSSALARDFEGVPSQKPPTPRTSGIKDAEKMFQPVSVWITNVAGATAISSGDWDRNGGAQILVVAGRKLHVFDPNGAEKLVLSLPGEYSIIEYGRDHQQGARLLGFSNWGRKVDVVSKDGKVLWSYSSMLGIDGAHWGDLDGDGTDELIVGMNGFGGLQALSAGGKKLWHVSLGNVWSQAVISAGPDGRALVFASEAGGTIRVFDGQGAPLRTLRPAGAYCTRLAATVVDRSGQAQVLVLGQVGGGSTEQAIALDAKGRVAWSAPVNSAGGWVQVQFASGDVFGDGNVEWAFVDSSGALALVTRDGQKLAAVPNQSGIKDFMILPVNNGKGLLVTLRGAAVQAYSFR